MKILKSQLFRLLVLISISMACFSCASVYDAKDTFDGACSLGIEIHGFWTGLINGFVLPLALLAKIGSVLLGYWQDVALWESLTNGIPYWFGFFCGNLALTYIAFKTYDDFFYFHPIKRFATYFAPFILVYLAALLWGDIPKPQLPKLSRSQMVTIFSYHSPEDGACYYVKRYPYYDSMNEVYCDSIIPVLLEGSYQDAKKVNKILEGTPAGIVFSPLFEEMRYNYQQLLYEELNNLTSNLKEHFIQDISLYMPTVIDSVLTVDAEAIVDSYSGGFLNYKKIVLWWNSGDNYNQFESLVMQRMAQSSLEQDIQKFIREYMSVLLNSYSECHRGLFGDSLEIQMPDFSNLVSLQGTIHDMKKDVETLSSDEANEYAFTLIRDGVVPAALALGTGNVTSMLSLGYTVVDAGVAIANIIKNYKNTELDFEEKLKLYLTSKLNDMVTVDMEALDRIACDCFDRQNELLANEINERI